MKIICESLDEYDLLMRFSKTLHDFRVSLENFAEDFDDNGNPIDIKDRIIGFDYDDEVSSFMKHLYLTIEDFPNKREKIIIENQLSLG